MLFALPFAAVGVGMTWWSWRIMARHEAMKSWVEVPATITHAELQTRRSDDGTTFRAIAKYQYEFGGRQFTGERVSLHGGSDNLGSFQWNAHRELEFHLRQRKPFRCFVNPQDPSEAVLYRQLRWEMSAFFTLFATAFGAVGFGMLVGALATARRLPALGPAAGVLSDKPWLTRADWATGEIRAGSGAVAAPVLGVVAAWWMVASTPLVMQMPEIFQSTGSRWAAITLAFPAVGGVLLWAFVYQFLRRRKFGDSLLQLAATPGVVGGQLAGVIRIPKMIRPTEGFRLKLSCIEHIRTGHGKDTQIVEEPLWQEERLVTEPMRDRVGGAIAVPVLFAIPYEVEETSRPGSDRHIEWRLEASAETRGVDYKSCFEVPVFKTADSRPGFQLDERLAAEFAAAPPRALLLREAGILKEPLPGGGVRLLFPMGRNLEVALPLSVIAAVWGGAVWAMFHFGVFFVFPIVFGLIELGLLWIVMRLWLYRSVLEAHSNGLRFSGGLLGIGREKQLAADDVKELMTRQSMGVGTKVWNDIIVVVRDGKERTIAHAIEGQLTQRAIVEELNAALGREIPLTQKKSKLRLSQ